MFDEKSGRGLPELAFGLSCIGPKQSHEFVSRPTGIDSRLP